MSNNKDDGEDYQLFEPGRREGTVEKPTDKRFAVLGAMLGLGGVGYMAKKFKDRPAGTKTSVYLIHTRLLAQGTVVGVLTLGMIYQMYISPQNKGSHS